MELNHKKGLIVGLGKSGVAAARFLKRRGADVTVTDMADEAHLSPAVAEVRGLRIPLELGGHRTATFEKADFIIVSPGVPHTIAPLQQARAKGIPVLGELELACRFSTEPIVAVSGTNGKTTTTTLLGLMLKDSGRDVFVGGNIGAPLIGHVDSGRQVDLIVVEVSSFQLDTSTTLRPRVAVLLNIAPDHLDRYPDFAAYVASKCRLFQNQGADDTAIVNGADRRLLGQCQPLAGHTLFFNDRRAAEEGADIEADRIVLHVKDQAPVHLPSGAANIVGRHNQENIAAASLAALAAGATLDGVLSALGRFQGLPHRLEALGTLNGVRYVNDSKATNIDAVARALECFDRPVILIMGGRTKGDDFKVLAQPLQRHVKRLIALGEAQATIVAALGAVVPISRARTMDDAVRQARAVAQAGETVLLSPACASFDMYNNYAERGDHFRAVFHDLAETN
jgi:UDP-N-acetylmuramoylalanine--D-glutamate ligase